MATERDNPVRFGTDGWRAIIAEDFTFVSTAGRAFLEWMEGKALPGIEALKG